MLRSKTGLPEALILRKHSLREGDVQNSPNFWDRPLSGKQVDLRDESEYNLFIGGWDGA